MRNADTCFVVAPRQAEMAAVDDVDRWMVRSGWALAFVRYSRAYQGDENAARTAHAGL